MNAGLCSKSGVVVPLVGVEVEGEVIGAYARVHVRQRYRSDEQRPIEAVYTFPLPADATLTAFSMTCEGRRIEGSVKERDAAFRAYDDALVAGHGAALLEHERPNVFTANVGNLLPGEETLVEVEYLQRVQADEGSLRWMIPTLVAPRYIPGTPVGDRTAHGVSAPTDRVPDADRVTPRGVAEVPYGLRMDLSFDLGRALRVESPSHAIAVTHEGSRARVRFAQTEVALDRDVVVTARAVPNNEESAPMLTSGVATHRVKGRDGYVALSVVPDLYNLGAEASQRSSVVFLLDASGSMAGDSILEARAALRLCLRHLRGGDRFNIIAFSSSHVAFEAGIVAFDEGTLARADRWIEAVGVGGGTELLAPLALATSMAEGGVVVLLTDGEVGNEDEILREVLKRRGDTKTRVYSFGVGTNVSDALLRDLARETQGAVEFIHPGERIDEKVVAQFSRAVAPRITDVTVRFVGVDVGEIAPNRVADLVDGEVWTLFGRYSRGGAGSAEIAGRHRGEAFAMKVPLDLPEEVSRPVVAKLWAAERVRDFEDARVEGRRAETMKQRIVELAVEHGIASRFTSFVVVEQRTGDRRATGMPETAVVPVNLPAGWAMFDEERARVKSAKKRGMPPLGARRSVAVPASASRSAPMVMPRMARAKADVSEGDAWEGGAADVQGDAFADAPACAEACGAEWDDALADLVMPAPALMLPPAEAKKELREESATHGGGALEALFARQLASGLWDDASLGSDGELRQLRATVAALRTLVERGVDTKHAIYGGPLRKSLDALAALAAKLAATERDLCERALGAAWVLATGQRTRSALEALIEKGAYVELGGLRGDPAGLRAWVLAGGA